MPQNYLKYLELSCKKFKKLNKGVLDIVIYGSSVKGKLDFNDVDLMVVFNNMGLRERLEIAQSLKAKLKRELPNPDIKTMNFVDFFDESFLARQGLLVEGISLIKNKALAELVGFKGFGIFTYNLKNLDHNKKTQFTYALIGRNSEGIIKRLQGKPLGRGAVQIPIRHSNEFESFLQKWNIEYKAKKILESSL